MARYRVTATTDDVTVIVEALDPFAAAEVADDEIAWGDGYRPEWRIVKTELLPEPYVVTED